MHSVDFLTLVWSWQSLSLEVGGFTLFSLCWWTWTCCLKVKFTVLRSRSRWVMYYLQQSIHYLTAQAHSSRRTISKAQFRVWNKQWQQCDEAWSCSRLGCWKCLWKWLIGYSTWHKMSIKVSLQTCINRKILWLLLRLHPRLSYIFRLSCRVCWSWYGCR